MIPPPPAYIAAEGGGIMFSCNRSLCQILFWAGIAFLVSALINSFWVSFLLGGLLAGLGLVLRGP